MYPELIKIGPFPVHTYGFLIAIGFILAVEVLRVHSNQAKMETDKILETAYRSLLIGFLGARFFFVLTQLSEFSRDPMGVFRFWEGGFVFFGGPIFVIPYLVWWAKKNRIKIWSLLDISAPSLALGHAFGRFGCLAAGCCYGRPTGTSYGVKLYSNIVEPYLQGIPLHPTQLYEAFSLLTLFGGLLWLSKRKVFDGQVALSYLIAYPVIRSVIEIFRGDIVRGFVIEGVISTSQFISIFVFMGAVGVLVYRLRQIQKESAQVTSAASKPSEVGAAE